MLKTRRRLAHYPHRPSPKVGNWALFLHPNVLAALVTVIFGTIGGTIITYMIQSSTRRSEEAEVRRSADLDKESKAFDEAVTTIRKTLLASQNMISLGGESFDLSRRDLTPNERSGIKRQIDATTQAYVTAIANWEVQQEQLGMDLMAHSERRGAVKSLWNDLAKSVDTFSSCAKEYKEVREYHHVQDSKLMNACREPRDTVNQNIGKLSELIFRKD